MTSDLYIYRTASVLIREHGEDAAGPFLPTVCRFVCKSSREWRARQDSNLQHPA